jgi:transposase InsO family protein
MLHCRKMRCPVPDSRLSSKLNMKLAALVPPGPSMHPPSTLIVPSSRASPVRRRRDRKRAVGTRRPILLPVAANHRWSLDFVSDALSHGRRFRKLCVVDDFTREALAVVVDTSLSGVRVARELDRLIEQRGTPRMIVSDNGAELSCCRFSGGVSEGHVKWPEIRGLDQSLYPFKRHLRRAPYALVPNRAAARCIASSSSQP